MSIDVSPYVEVDVTDWPRDEVEQLGTKPKVWLRHPGTQERWLLKYVTYNFAGADAEFVKGDDWAERIAHGVAHRLGVPAARTELAVEHLAGARFGVISRSVLAPHEREAGAGVELVLGNQLLPEPVTDRARTSYTLEAIQAAIGDVVPPAGAPPEFSAWETFIGYLLLDALIGNTDRHEENWAVISSPEHKRLAPTFDHASSLGFQLSDEDREERLRTGDRGFTPEAYADRARAKFAGRPRLVDAARHVLDQCAPAVRDHWLSRCSDVDRLVEPVWLVPQNRMTEPARQFAERVLRRNCAQLLDARD